MLKKIRRFFENERSTSGKEEKENGHDVMVATCALFLEMARIDKTFTDEEMGEILNVLEKEYDLTREKAGALLEAADQELKDSVDLWQFASLINENYSVEEKIQIIEILWKIVYVDGKLDKYEDYLMHKLEQLLRISHRQLIEAKMKVLHPDR